MYPIDNHLVKHVDLIKCSTDQGKWFGYGKLDWRGKFINEREYMEYIDTIANAGPYSNPRGFTDPPLHLFRSVLPLTIHILQDRDRTYNVMKYYRQQQLDKMITLGITSTSYSRDSWHVVSMKHNETDHTFEMLQLKDVLETAIGGSSKYTLSVIAFDWDTANIFADNTMYDNVFHWYIGFDDFMTYHNIPIISPPMPLWAYRDLLYDNDDVSSHEKINYLLLTK